MKGLTAGTVPNGIRLGYMEWQSAKETSGGTLSAG